jgi:hypothetical protein
MPGTKRRKSAPKQIGLTEAALEAWKCGDEHTLDRELKVRPWEPSPFDVSRPEPPQTRTGGVWEEGWPRAWRLRQELIRVAGPPGRSDRHGRPLGPRAKR